MTDIVIQGIGGRMGHVLCDMIAQREDCRVIAGIDLKDGEQNGIPVYDSLEKLAGKVKTVQGGEITLATAGGVTVDGAKVSATDIVADNGVIHVIDSVIMPK